LDCFLSSFFKLQLLVEHHLFTPGARNPSRALETLQRNHLYAQIGCVTWSWTLKMYKTFCKRPYAGVLPGKRNSAVELGGRKFGGKRALE